ncbi:MAG: dephospho-CoA kinase [Candidatus Rifleibacteriota bacterium]
MLIIGVCGQTGAGKSTLAEMLENCGLGQNLEVDQIGHRLLTEKQVIQELVKVFGSEILNSDSKVDRKALGRKAFKDQKSIDKLNEIMHPAMKQEVKRIIAQQKAQGKRFLIINAALLFSMNLDKLCNKLIYVVTSPAIRLKRLLSSRNWSEQAARQRLFAQDSMPEGRDDIIIIHNDQSETELKAKAIKLAATLKENIN